MALNTGTKTEPKFGPPQDIKGEDRLKREVHAPDGWAMNAWTMSGNALAYSNVVNTQSDSNSNPPEGSSCLKLGYWATAQQTFPIPAEGIPGSTQRITLIHRGLTWEVGKRYHFSFKAKGGAIEKLHWVFRSYYHGLPASTKIERDERGGVKRGTFVEEDLRFEQDCSVGSSWTTVQGDFTARWKNPTLAGEKTMGAVFYLDFWANNLTGNLYVDDFQVAEVP